MAFPPALGPNNAPAHLSRRWFLSVGCAALAALACPPAARAQLGVISPEALDAFLDIILPAHRDAPRASTMNLGAAVLMKAQDSPDTLRLLVTGVDFLDTLGPAPFARLPSTAQADVVAWMAASDPSEVPAQFYHAMRNLALQFYYADPSTLVHLPLNTTPQPKGYAPPWDIGVQTAQDQTGIVKTGPMRMGPRQ